MKMNLNSIIIEREEKTDMSLKKLTAELDRDDCRATTAGHKDPANTDAKSGGTRYSEGKPSGFWYGPLFGLRLVAEVWRGGSEKYAPLDWQQGQSFSSLFDCMSRHWLAVVMDGVWARDPDSGAYHMAHLVWNALTLLTFMAKNRHDLDDMTFWRGATAAQAQDWRKEQGVDSNFDVTDPQVGESLGRSDPRSSVYSPAPDRAPACSASRPLDTTRSPL